MIEFLNLINASTAWLLSVNPGVGYTIMGLLVTSLIGIAGFAAARLRFSPVWVLTMLVPFLSLIIIWILAYCRWPVDNTKNGQAQ